MNATQTTKPRATVTGPMMFDFKTGKLASVDPGSYPVGTVVSYADMANPRTRYVITGPAADVYGQPCVSETGARSTVSRSATRYRRQHSAKETRIQPAPYRGGAY